MVVIRLFKSVSVTNRVENGLCVRFIARCVSDECLSFHFCHEITRSFSSFCSQYGIRSDATSYRVAARANTRLRGLHLLPATKVPVVQSGSFDLGDGRPQRSNGAFGARFRNARSCASRPFIGPIFEGQQRVDSGRLAADKVVRLHAQTAIENGFVFLPDEAARLADSVSELTTFPAGRHDDQVDSTAQALAWMKRRSAGAEAWIEFYGRRVV